MACRGQVRSVGAAFVVEPVTGEACGCSEHFTASLEVPSPHVVAHPGEIIHRPIGRGGSSRQCGRGGFQGRFCFGLLHENFCQVDFFPFGKRGHCVGPDAAHELDKTGASTIVGRFEKPLEIVGAQGVVPTVPQHAQRTGILHLFFLRDSGIQQTDGLPGRAGRLQVNQSLA